MKDPHREKRPDTKPGRFIVCQHGGERGSVPVNVNHHAFHSMRRRTPPLLRRLRVRTDCGSSGFIGRPTRMMPGPWPRNAVAPIWALITTICSCFAPRMHQCDVASLFDTRQRHATCFEAFIGKAVYGEVVRRPGACEQSLRRGAKRLRGVKNAIAAANGSRTLDADDARGTWVCWGTT